MVYFILFYIIFTYLCRLDGFCRLLSLLPSTVCELSSLFLTHSKFHFVLKPSLSCVLITASYSQSNEQPNHRLCCYRACYVYTDCSKHIVCDAGYLSLNLFVNFTATTEHQQNRNNYSSHTKSLCSTQMFYLFI